MRGNNSIVHIMAYFLLLAVAGSQVISLFFWNYLYGEEIHQIVILIFSTTLIVALPVLVMFSYILRDVGSKNSKLLKSQATLNTQKAQLTEAMTKLRVTRDIAIEASDAKSRFLANMSHEFRTPLNAIIGYTELLLEEFEASAPAQALEDLEKVQLSSRQLLDLVNDILDLAKIEAGKEFVSFSSVPLKMMVSESMDVVRHLAERNQNELIVEIEDSLKEVNVDPGKLRRCLINLLSNASKFTNQGKITLKVWTENKSRGPYVFFSVTDTGIGMTPDEMDRVFDHFTQADETTTRRYGGSGLGLTITRKMIQLMNGDVSVASEKGKGSVFTIKLPQPSQNTESLEALDTETSPPNPL
jgi:signal transduction histidine kinase